MKKFLTVSTIAVAISLLGGCDNVPSGFVGVKVDRYGDDRGVQNETLGPGRYYTGINTDVFVFPTFLQNGVWGGPEEAVTFQTSEGLAVTAAIGYSYRIPRDKVTFVFQQYRKGADEITSVVLRNMTRDALNQVAATMGVEDVYGKGKLELQTRTLELVRKQAGAKGIELDNLYFVGKMALPDSVSRAIDAKIKATQIAMQKENELRAAEADAAKKVAEAEGQAKANELLAESLRANPAVLQAQAIEKWDGKLPQFIGDGPVPFINVK